MDLDVDFLFEDDADGTADGDRVAGVADAVGAEVKVGVVPDAGESIVDGIDYEVGVIFARCSEDIEKVRAIGSIGSFVIEGRVIDGGDGTEKTGQRFERRIVSEVKMDSGDFIEAEIVKSDFVGHPGISRSEEKFEFGFGPGGGNSGRRKTVFLWDDIFRKEERAIKGGSMNAAGDQEKGEGRFHEGTVS